MIGVANVLQFCNTYYNKSVCTPVLHNFEHILNSWFAIFWFGSCIWLLTAILRFSYSVNFGHSKCQVPLSTKSGQSRQVETTAGVGAKQQWGVVLPWAQLQFHGNFTTWKTSLMLRKKKILKPSLSLVWQALVWISPSFVVFLFGIISISYNGVKQWPNSQPQTFKLWQVVCVGFPKYCSLWHYNKTTFNTPKHRDDCTNIHWPPGEIIVSVFVNYISLISLSSFIQVVSSI